MPLLLAIVGAALIVSAIRDTQAQLGSLLVSDVPAFMPWAAAILVIGFIGFVPELRKVSRALLALVLIVIFLKKGSGFFAQFSTALKNPAAAQAATLPTLKGPLPITIAGGATGSGGPLGGLIGAATDAATGGIGGIGGAVSDVSGTGGLY